MPKLFLPYHLKKETNNEDYILIENGGAYGYTMSSNYNLRPPADEFIIKYE